MDMAMDIYMHIHIYIYTYTRHMAMDVHRSIDKCPTTVESMTCTQQCNEPPELGPRSNPVRGSNQGWYCNLDNTLCMDMAMDIMIDIYPLATSMDVNIHAGPACGSTWLRRKAWNPHLPVCRSGILSNCCSGSASS